MFEQVGLAPNVRPLSVDVIGDVGQVLWVLLGTVGIVLLIACANVANLFLVRAEGRQQELAIHAALGANWRRLAWELLSESMTLALTGGVIGLGLAYAGIKTLVSIAPEGLPRLEEISIDPTVLLFTLAISLIAGVLFGVIPVIKFATPHLAGALKEGGRLSSASRGRHRARNTLVVVEIGLAVVLLVASGLMIRTFQAMRKVDPGFGRPAEVLTFRVSRPRYLDCGPCSNRADSGTDRQTPRAGPWRHARLVSPPPSPWTATTATIRSSWKACRNRTSCLPSGGSRRSARTTFTRCRPGWWRAERLRGRTSTPAPRSSWSAKTSRVSIGRNRLPLWANGFAKRRRTRGARLSASWRTRATMASSVRRRRSSIFRWRSRISGTRRSRCFETWRMRSARRA